MPSKLSEHPVSPEELCSEGHYPYPDSCVKLVVGMSEKTGALSLLERMQSMLVIATKDDVAQIAFRSRFPGFVPLLVSSLDDVRLQVQQMRDLARDHPGGWLSRKLLQPYMVTYYDSYDRIYRRFVMAGSSIQARQKIIPAPFAGTALPQNMLEELLFHMERAKTGQDQVEYAWDYRKGGDFEKYARRKKIEMPAEERAWYEKTIRSFKERFPDEINVHQ